MPFRCLTEIAVHLRRCPTLRMKPFSFSLSITGEPYLQAGCFNTRGIRRIVGKGPFFDCAFLLCGKIAWFLFACLLTSESLPARGIFAENFRAAVRHLRRIEKQCPHKAGDCVTPGWALYRKLCQKALKNLRPYRLPHSPQMDTKETTGPRIAGR